MQKLTSAIHSKFEEQMSTLFELYLKALFSAEYYL
jgi:hypothetical protein